MRPAQPAALHQRFTPAPLALAAAMAIAMAAGHAPLAHAQSGAPTAAATPIAINIPAQPLGQALNELARQANLQMTFPASLVAGKQAPAVSGQLTVRQALDRLLTGGELLANVDGAAVVVRAAAQVQPEATLPAVTVSARRQELETVVVRKSTGGALFGEADTREIPFAVNIVGEPEIRNRQATTLAEMLATDPSIGFEYQDAGGMPFDRLSIRGFTQSNQIINGQLTGLDVIAAQAENVDRVEALRGPAAFRYGFVQAGGVINTVTKRPTDDAKTTLTLQGAAASQLGAHLDHSSHFDNEKRFGYRLNAVFSDGDTAIDTTQRRRSLLSFATDFKLTDDLTLYADLTHSDIKARGGNSFFPNIQIASDGRALDPINPRRTFQPDWNFFDGESLTGGLEIEYKLAPQWQFNSMFRYLDATDRGYGGVTFYNAFQPNGDHVLSNYGYKNKYDTWSSVSFVQGQLSTGAVSHKLTAGISYLNNDYDGFQAANSNTVSVPSNIYAPVILPKTDAGPYAPSSAAREKQSGAFVSNEMRIGQWRPLIGLRYSKLEYDATWNSGKSNTSKVSPMLALSYDVNDAITLYSSYSTGLENGGLAPLGTTNANAQMPPLVSKGYEFGVKTDLLDGAATLDASIFSVEKTSAFTDSSNTFVQKGNQVHKGVEVMARGRFWKPLEVSAGFTYIDAKLKDDPATDGNRPVNVPRLSTVLFGEYAVASLPGLYLSGQVTYRSARDYNLPNKNQVPGYTLLGLGGRYVTTLNGQKSTFRINVDNLTNEAYYKMIDTFGGTLGAPMTIKASLELAF
ncbi:MAG: TonB-dependent receptor [Hydrogenophaga sp.]|jgi:iron complex outermembrane receptor protein|nr:TonB-dependent receptor [Hydrogenophaga sp.]